MFDLIRLHQLNIMLILCGACGILVFLLIITRFITKRRKGILIFMEAVAFFLLWFDREAYIYSGHTGSTAYLMVRLSNFMVFFITSAIVFGFYMYLRDLLTTEGKLKTIPMRLSITGSVAVMGMILAIISSFINLYYYFDENNVYHRGPGFLIAYIIPIICPIMQYTVIRQYKKLFSKLIYVSLVLYIFVPIICGILQIFTYGISIVNIAMVAVSVSLYIFMYLDLNNTVERAHETELENMQGEKERMRRLFDQTATAFVSAVEKKDDFMAGNSIKIAEYAKRIAELSGKDEDECEKVYYTALLHDVGLIGIPDNIIKNEEDPGKWDYEAIRKKPLIGADILSSITEYPYLAQGAHYSHERYNGTGYPDGLKGEEIPEYARIVAVADAFVTMTSKKRYREAKPDFMAREAFVKGAGEEFDPEFSKAMISIIDEDIRKKSEEIKLELEDEIICSDYREKVSCGIKVERDIKKITFDCVLTPDGQHRFSAPSIILFDSYDGRTHNNEKAIEGYHYLEYGEIWFDKYSIATAARRIEENPLADDFIGTNTDGSLAFEIIAGRYEDHLKLIMKSRGYSKEVIVALTGGTKACFIGLTGESCRISNIKVEDTGKTVALGDIPRIADKISYIDHMESDIPNIQIDRARSATTAGVEIKNRRTISFHSMSLPGSNLVWHCPYIVLFSSANGTVGGEDYREYTLIKLNGENENSDESVANKFSMKRNDDFTDWDDWKKINKKGADFDVHIERRGNQIILRAENLGISIENITTISNDGTKIYAAITGDQVAITDIRIE